MSQVSSWMTLWNRAAGFLRAIRLWVKKLISVIMTTTFSPLIPSRSITSNGVSRLVRFWLSRDGYAPYLERLRKEKSA